MNDVAMKTATKNQNSGQLWPKNAMPPATSKTPWIVPAFSLLRALDMNLSRCLKPVIVEMAIMSATCDKEREMDTNHIQSATARDRSCQTQSTSTHG